jgi:predicted RNase H-like HicB family nuclease
VSRRRVADEALSYRARAERDQAGYWHGSVPDLPGVHTQARTLATLRRRVAEAIALWLDLPDSAEARMVVDVEPVLPAAVRRAVSTARRRRARAAVADAEADRATDEAIAALRRAGLSLRDVGTVVGLSHQRVDQREAS